MNLLPKLDRLLLTPQEKLAAERWLQTWSFFSDRMTKESFSEEAILRLLKYEMQTRKRKTAINRLTARYFKLLKKRSLEEILEKVYGNTRTEDRRLLSEEG